MNSACPSAHASSVSTQTNGRCVEASDAQCVAAHGTSRVTRSVIGVLRETRRETSSVSQAGPLNPSSEPSSTFSAQRWRPFSTTTRGVFVFTNTVQSHVFFRIDEDLTEFSNFTIKKGQKRSKRNTFLLRIKLGTKTRHSFALLHTKSQCFLDVDAFKVPVFRVSQHKKKKKSSVDEI